MAPAEVEGKRRSSLEPELVLLVGLKHGDFDVQSLFETGYNLC